MYAKDLNEPKYQFFIKKPEDAGTKNLHDPKAKEYSAYMVDVYSNINDYNPSGKRKILVVFDDMIADIMTNKKFQAIIKELLLDAKNKYIVYIHYIVYFSVPKEVRLSSIHYLIMKIHNKKELQQIAINHSAGTDYKYFMKIYRKCTSEPYIYILTNDTTLAANNFLRFRKNLLHPL